MSADRPKKRLSDGEFEARYNRELAGPHGVNASLRDDHIQARVDRKCLMDLIRERIGCSACDRSLLTTSIPRCPWCATAEALLAEVSP